ncbi:MAG: YigZ family protein [Clostridia bacterium]|nr:YigZ family protein [Clostridia bacterium]MDD4376332.1 YigZ family protein [Clostridia bacterium]
MNKDKHILASDITNSEYGEIASGYYDIKKSKFYSYIFHVSSSEEVEEYISKIKKDHKKARHVVYAYEYYTDNVKYSKFSNDNEPQGTGVNSVISTMEHESVTNYLVVIVRYFGGTLLGAGPLLRSYLTSFKEAFAKCNKEKI